MQSFGSKRTDIILKTLMYALFIMLAFSIIYPIFWVTITSLKTNPQVVEAPFSLPPSFRFQNYMEAWKIAGFTRLFVNSLSISLLSCAIILISTSLGAYAFVRYDFRGKNALMFYFLVGLMIPPHMLMIPSFRIMSILHLLNTPFSAVLTYSSWVCFGIFFLRAYFLSIPQEMFDAASMDGCSEISIFFRIVMPISAPGLTTVIIFYFVWTWNDFLFPLVYLTRESSKTVTLGIMNFAGKWTTYWNLQAAAISIALWFPIIFYIIFRKRIQKGLAEGAIKF